MRCVNILPRIAHYAVRVSNPGNQEPPGPQGERKQRPQWLILMLFAAVDATRTTAVPAGSVLEVLGQLGVGSHATRSTLTRMANRGLLERHRRGREMSYSLTEHAEVVLQAGRELALEPVDRSWDGVWTIVAVSLPETKRALRYRVSSRMTAEGFGQLQNGLWISPHKVDIMAVLGDLDTEGCVSVFIGHSDRYTLDEALIAKAFDLNRIARRYLAFVDRWNNPQPAAQGDELTALVSLLAEWGQAVRADPRLPLEHLPQDWPGRAAQELFVTHSEELAAAVARTAPQRLRLELLQTDSEPRPRLAGSE